MARRGVGQWLCLRGEQPELARDSGRGRRGDAAAAVGAAGATQQPRRRRWHPVRPRAGKWRRRGRALRVLLQHRAQRYVLLRYCYDTATLLWHHAPATERHQGGAMAVVGHTVMVAGGYTGDFLLSKPTAVVDIFDVSYLSAAAG